MALGQTSRIRSMREPLYRLRFESAACNMKALLGYVPVLVTPGTRSLKSSVALNPWLRAGANSLRIEISPRAGAARLDSRSASVKGKITVGDMTQPQDARDEITLVEFELDPAVDNGTYPILIEKEFDAPTAFPEWTWLSAPRLTIDDAFKREAVDVVQRAWDALRKKDIDTVIGMQVVRNKEMSQAMFQPLDERIRDVRADLDRLTRDNTLRDLNPGEFAFPLFAGKRLARIDDADGYAPIRYDFQDTGMFAAVPIFLTRNERGRLIWVR